jgi:hypothetical protein
MLLEPNAGKASNFDFDFDFDPGGTVPKAYADSESLRSTRRGRRGVIFAGF